MRASGGPVVPAPAAGGSAELSGLQAADAARRHREQRIAYWNAVHRARRRWRGLGGAYHRRLAAVLRALLPPGLRVLELGCGGGDLLAALAPATGVGVDFSREAIDDARAAHPELELVEGDAHDVELAGTFDAILLSDLVNDLWDVQGVLERLRRHCHARTRVVITMYNRVWQPVLALARALRLARPTLDGSWLHREDVANLLHLADYEVIRTRTEILLPLPLPVLAGLANRVLARIWPLRHLALTHVVVARPRGLPPLAAAPRVSVVVPARDEAGNIPPIVESVPEMGAGTELIFVEGHSRDDTYAAIERAIAAHPERRCLLLRQTGEGKGDAVRLGFAHATGDILIILDADLTVPPADLPRFVDALTSGRAELANGVRLVYPMEGEAMRFANLIGNRFFNLAFSWLLEQPIKDTLCGTKALWRRDYELIAAHRAYFGRLDPFGDFDLLFGAARFSLRIVDLPVRYRARTYGVTNIRRWRHGALLLRMAALAAVRLKFV